MRLWLSDKAAKQLKGEGPPAETFECEHHGTQAYVRTPEKLLEEMGRWACGECVRQAGAKERADKEAKAHEEEQAREAKKSAKKAAREAIETADEELATALETCQGVNARARTTKQRLRDKRRRQNVAARIVEERREALEEARRALEVAEAELEASTVAVPPLEETLSAEREELGAHVTSLKAALDVADEAWKQVPPKVRKRRNRRARHQAIQLIEAHAEPDADEAPAAEAAAVTEAVETSEPVEAAETGAAQAEGAETEAAEAEAAETEAEAV